MAAAAGILNSQGAQPMAGRAAPMDNPASGSDAAGSTGRDSATISANDFLTLLVTEMQNQDPTTATDPNEYINQLVQVNSLEQLIGIHETLTAALGESAAASTGSGPAPQAAQAHSPTRVPSLPGSSPAASGNLSIPASSAAAQRVAHALNGRTAPQAEASRRLP